MKYLDPDGNRFLTAKEKDFVSEILGDKSEFVTSAIILPLPGNRAVSLPVGVIGLTSNYQKQLNDHVSVNKLIHESYHQVQYFDHNSDKREKNLYEKISDKISSKNMTKLVFLSFVSEQFSYTLNNNEVYKYGSIDDIGKLSDITYLEAQAQFVGDFAELYYKIRYEGSLIGMKQLVKMNQIIENSGIYSEATKWIDENLK